MSNEKVVDLDGTFFWRMRALINEWDEVCELPDTKAHVVELVFRLRLNEARKVVTEYRDRIADQTVGYSYQRFIDEGMEAVQKHLLERLEKYAQVTDFYERWEELMIEYDITMPRPVREETHEPDIFDVGRVFIHAREPASAPSSN